MLNPKTIKLNAGESDFDVAFRMVENKVGWWILHNFYTHFMFVLFCTFDQEVDAYVNGLIATPERKAKADITYYIWTELYSLIVPLPEEESRLFAFVGTFQPLVMNYLAVDL